VIECYQETLGFRIKKNYLPRLRSSSIVKNCGKIYRHYKVVSGSIVTCKPSLALRGFSSIRFHIGRTIVEFVVAVLVFVFPVLEKGCSNSRLAGPFRSGSLGCAGPFRSGSLGRLNYLHLPKGILPL